MSDVRNFLNVDRCRCHFLTRVAKIEILSCAFNVTTAQGDNRYLASAVDGSPHDYTQQYVIN